MTQPCSTRRSSDLLGATQHRHAISQIMDMLVFLDIVADHHHALYAFGGELSADLRHAEAAVHRLPTGHGYGIVVENLVGDLHICRDGSPDRENAGVEIGRSEEHTSELQSLMRISYAVFCLKKKKTRTTNE